MKRRYFYASAIVLLLLTAGCSLIRSTGRNPKGAELTKVEAASNYQDGQFRNLDTVPGDFIPVKRSRILKDMLHKSDSVRPAHALPGIRTDLTLSYNRPTIIWFGHSTFLIKTDSLNILVDPELNSFAGPVSRLVPAFRDSLHYSVDDLPVIDVLLVSHDHYDHLDYQTVKKLRSKVKQVVVPLGVGSHFMRWGYDSSKIHELNWFDTLEINQDLTIRSTPGRHFSGRTFKGNKTLWSSYVLQIGTYRFFYSGDTGYGKHFKMIGQRFGPFDLALMECGQYNLYWPYSHMFPYQTAQAAADLKARMIIPVHWGKFAESNHAWNASVKNMLPVADSLGIPVCIPRIGQPYTIGNPVLRTGWWN